MSPDPDRRQTSFPQLQYPILRDVELKSPQQWLKGKQIQDGAEGLWRIHDSLYDFTEFIPLHPGGRQWIAATKGTDITEAFETHHLKGIAETLTLNYFVRTATTPRNSPFTFQKDDFYETLKQKVALKLKEMPEGLRNKSNWITDSMLLGLIVVSPLCCWAWPRSHILAGLLTILNSYMLSCLTVCAHNYFHRADNWRMYLFNFSGFSYEDWRISHAMSHHLFTNTLQDIELSRLEPFLNFMPRRDKPLFAQLGALYWPAIFPFVTMISHIKELMAGTLKSEGKTLNWPMLIPYTWFVWMYYMAGAGIIPTFCIWLVTMSASSFFFMVFGLTAGHHADANFFDGDIPRSETLDWGLHQLDTMIERSDFAGRHFLSLTSFGDHALHHLFPTLDHGELQLLYPTLLQHCEKYDVQLRWQTICPALLSHSKQLARKSLNDFRVKKNM